MSQTATQSVRGKKHVQNVTRERPYDFLYDPVYTVSCGEDHIRSAVKAQTSKLTLRRVPHFDSMFSSLPHHPSYTLQPDPAQPLPPSVDRQWRGHGEQQRQEAVQMRSRVALKTDGGRVTGADVWKYLKRPLVPFTQQLPLHLTLSLPRLSGDNGRLSSNVTVGVQTDFRENEMQTEPYTPGYLVKAGATPTELLQLAHLTWGRGLPAGAVEVQMIERAREKRVWEAFLPPLDDLSRQALRRKMIEEMAVKELGYKKEEIQRLQDGRLAVMTDVMTLRRELEDKVYGDRRDRVLLKLEGEHEAWLQRRRGFFSRSIRKLEVGGRKMTELLEPQRFPHLSRPLLVRRRTSRRRVHLQHSHTYDGEDVEIRALASFDGSCSHKSLLRAQLSSSKALKQFQIYKTLRQGEEEKALRFLYRREKPIPRPAIPRVEQPAEGEEEKELAVIHLQKLLRGRSVQYQMFKGKQKQKDLIQELRSTHALQREEQLQQEDDKQMVITQKRDREKHTQQICQQGASQDGLIGEELQHLFDTLSKELVRFQEERRIHAFMSMAQSERRRREAEESGRRQLEEQRRREEDEIFKQVVQVHQGTVDLYLDDIVMKTVEQTADEQAREEIFRRAEEINQYAYALEASRNTVQSEEIVSELVYSFLIPEVEKMNFRRRVHALQQRHLEAARRIIESSAEEAGHSSSS